MLKVRIICQSSKTKKQRSAWLHVLAVAMFMLALFLFSVVVIGQGLVISGIVSATVTLMLCLILDQE